jgi:adenosylhomocysteine nucleosidase
VRLGIVCGLRSEAAALGLRAEEAVFSGADAERAGALASRLAEEGAEALVSAGLAGALAPGLSAGKLLLPEAVVTPLGERFETSPLPAGRSRSGSLLGSDELVVSAARKAELHHSSGALAVDMESHAVAAAARRAGLPLYVIRAVSDDARRSLPIAARSAIKPDGTVDTPRTLLALLARPSDLGPLISLGRQAAAGQQTLRREGRAVLAALRAA